MSFPNLFDQFLKKKHVSHLFVHVIIWFHQLSQVFPIYFSSWSLQFVFSSPKFSQPIGACYHWVSSVFPTGFLSSPWCLISFGCPFLHCIFRFHQSSSPKSSLYHSFSSVFSQLLVTRFYLFSPTTCSFYHWRSSFSPSIPWFYHEISISFPHLFVHFSLGFISFPHILAHLVTGFFWVSPFLPFIRGFHNVPVLLQCVYYALSLSNLSIISSI